MASKYSIVEDTILKCHSHTTVGLALVIANDYKYEGSQLAPLIGTSKDADAMCNALSNLQYTVIPLQNVTKPQLVEVMSQITTLLSYYSCSYKRLVFVFAGHGAKNDFLCTQEGEELNLYDELIAMWLPEKCPHLAHIPKIYFIDACRGTKTDKGCTVLSRGGKPISSQMRFPSNGNYLVASATTPGHKSYETEGGGRWLCNVSKMLLKSDKSILDILTEVNAELIRMHQDHNIMYVQQPTLHSTLNEEVYFLRESRTGPAMEVTENPEESSKQQLQNYCQKHKKPLPIYKIEKRCHKTYCAKVYVARTCGWTTGELASTKKTAEESAATKLLNFLQN